MTQWALTRGIDGCLHVLPLGDDMAHTTRAEKCECKPQLSEHGNIVHNARDGREDYETGKRQRH